MATEAKISGMLAEACIDFINQDSSKHSEFNHQLFEKLAPWYVPPHVPSGHDVEHIARMISFWKDIQEEMGYDEKLLPLYITGALLHNIDRSDKAREVYGTIPEAGGLLPVIKAEDKEGITRSILEEGINGVGSFYGEEEKDILVKVVCEHNKFMDEVGDHPVLTAVRIADKIDRLSASGVWAISALRGSQLMMYPNKGYGSTAEQDLKSIYDDLFRVLEWPSMMPKQSLGLFKRTHLRLTEGLAMLIKQAEGIVYEHRRTLCMLGVYVENYLPADLCRALGTVADEIPGLKKFINDIVLSSEKKYYLLLESLYKK